MSILLARIDDRFIHGQVTVGWSQKLRPDCIVLANDDIAADAWRSRVYAQSVSPEIEVAVLALAAAAERLQSEPDPGRERTLLLTGSPADMRELADRGVPLPEINVGGMHYSAGKQELLPYVYVDHGDVEAFKALIADGCSLRAQQVPGGKETILARGLLVAMEERL
jgi:PTS system mannose-specific IIB component